MIVTKIDVCASLRSMAVGDRILLPLSCLAAAKGAANKMDGKWHVWRMKESVKVVRYE